MENITKMSWHFENRKAYVLNVHKLNIAKKKHCALSNG